jgi:hypothetical protein
MKMLGMKDFMRRVDLSTPTMINESAEGVKVTEHSTSSIIFLQLLCCIINGIQVEGGPYEQSFHN